MRFLLLSQEINVSPTGAAPLRKKWFRDVEREKFEFF